MREGIFMLNSNPISFGEIEKKDEKNFFIEGFISTSDRDLVDDIVTERALMSMIEQLKSRVIKLDFEHEAFRGESEIEMEINKTRIPLGKASDFTRIKEAEKNGILVRWDINPTWKKFDEKGNVVMDFDEIKFNVENGYYDAFSIAFIPTKDTFIVKDGAKIRLLDDMNLLNVALTGNPINPKASVTEIFMKSLDYLKKKSAKTKSNSAEKKPKKENDDEEEKEEKKNNIPKKIKKEVKMSEEENRDEANEQSESESAEESNKESGEEESNDESKEDSSESSEAEQKAEKARIEVKSRLDKIDERLDLIEKAINKPIQKAKSEQAPTQGESLKTQQKAIDEAQPLDQI